MLLRNIYYMLIWKEINSVNGSKSLEHITTYCFIKLHQNKIGAYPAKGKAEHIHKKINKTLSLEFKMDGIKKLKCIKQKYHSIQKGKQKISFHYWLNCEIAS